MRFSYIDSEGKEIEVDSVESLALRVELGAIQPDTRMYDAVADRWAPAREHPVFRSLSRGEEVLDEDVVPIGQDEAAAGAPGAESGTGGAGTGPTDTESDAPEPPDPEIEPGEPPEPEVEPGSPEPGPAEPADPEIGAGEPETGEAADGDPRSAPPEPHEDAPEEEAAAEAPSAGDADDPLGLDFQVTVSDDAADGPSRGPEDAAEGDASGAGEAAASAEDAAEPRPGSSEDDRDAEDARSPDDAAAEEDGEGSEELPLLAPAPERPLDPDWSVPEQDPVDAQDEPGATEESEPPAWAADEEALFTGERPASGAEPAQAPDGERETPEPGGGGDPGPGEAASDELPRWAREAGDDDAGPDAETGPAAGAGPGGASDAAATPPATDRPARETPPPRRQRRKPGPERPAHWERRSRRRSLGGRFVRLAAVLVVLGAAGAGAAYLVGGGFLGLGSAGADGGGAGDPALPQLPAALHDVMAEANAAAYEATLADLAGLVVGEGTPPRPPEGWLTGQYISSAGRYPDVRDYWREVRDAVERARSREGELFRRHLDARLEGSGLSGAELERVREAGLAHYAAGTEERTEAYGRALGIAEASLELHRLLVEREEDIVYEPYSSPGVSRDPVLEAVPSDSLLRTEMNRRVDGVMDRMDDAELPRPITTAGLMDRVIAGLREVEVVREPDRG